MSMDPSQLPELIYHGDLAKAQKWHIAPQNTSSNKPLNVLWTSPINPLTGKTEWSTWCEENDFRTNSLQNKYHIVPDEDARILLGKEDNPELRKYIIDDKRLNFEAIAQDYDALYVPNPPSMGLFDGWDVSTCIFFNQKYTVMNEKMYSLYKTGKYKLKKHDKPSAINPRFNFQPRKLHSISRLEPVNNSIEDAITELSKLCQNLQDESLDCWIVNNLANALAKNKNYKFGECCDNLTFSHDALEILLKHGMEPNFDMRYCSINKKSFKLLLQYGADPNRLLNNLLYVSSEDGYFRHLGSDGYDKPGVKVAKIIELCISAGADVNRPDADGKVPLMKARYPRCVETLLSMGANPDATDNNGNSIDSYFRKEECAHYRILNIKALQSYRKNKQEQNKQEQNNNNHTFPFSNVPTRQPNKYQKTNDTTRY